MGEGLDEGQAGGSKKEWVAPDFNMERVWGNKAQEFCDAIAALDGGNIQSVKDFLEREAEAHSRVAADSEEHFPGQSAPIQRRVEANYRGLIGNLEAGDLEPVRLALEEGAATYTRWAKAQGKKE